MNSTARHYQPEPTGEQRPMTRPLPMSKQVCAKCAVQLTIDEAKLIRVCRVCLEKVR